jgi:hypothetical protein
MTATIGDKPLPVARSTAGLREVLFDQIDRLRSGIATPAESNALATLCHKIGQSVLLEISVAKYANEMGLKNKALAAPGSIALNGGDVRTAEPPQARSPEAPTV